MAKAKDDLIDRVAKWSSHNRYLVTAAVISGAMLGGCFLEPKAVSPVSGKNMTADALLAEKEAELDRIRIERERGELDARTRMDNIRAKAEAEIRAIADANNIASQEATAKVQQLDSQYAVAGDEIEKEQGMLRDALELAKASGVAEMIPYVGSAIAGAAGLFAVGAGLDNRRKNGVIKKLKGEKPE